MSFDDGDALSLSCCLLALNAAAALFGAEQARLSGVLDQTKWHFRENIRSDGVSEPDCWSAFRFLTIFTTNGVELNVHVQWQREELIWRGCEGQEIRLD